MSSKKFAVTKELSMTKIKNIILTKKLYTVYFMPGFLMGILSQYLLLLIKSINLCIWGIISTFVVKMRSMQIKK